MSTFSGFGDEGSQSPSPTPSVGQTRKRARRNRLISGSEDGEAEDPTPEPQTHKPAGKGKGMATTTRRDSIVPATQKTKTADTESEGKDQGMPDPAPTDPKSSLETQTLTPDQTAYFSFLKSSEYRALQRHDIALRLGIWANARDRAVERLVEIERERAELQYKVAEMERLSEEYVRVNVVAVSEEEDKRLAQQWEGWVKECKAKSGGQVAAEEDEGGIEV